MRPVLSPPLLCAALLAFTGSASIAQAGGPAVCSAKHKRPANLYGSVLGDGVGPPTAAAAPAGGEARSGLGPNAAQATPPSATSGRAGTSVHLSRKALDASFAPCGKAPA